MPHPAGTPGAREQTRAATEARNRNVALAAMDDPKALARSVRIVRAALEHQRLTLDDITPDTLRQHEEAQDG